LVYQTISIGLLIPAPDQHHSIIESEGFEIPG